MVIVILIRYIPHFCNGFYILIYRRLLQKTEEWRSIKYFPGYRTSCYNAHCKAQWRDVSDYSRYNKGQQYSNIIDIEYLYCKIAQTINLKIISFKSIHVLLIIKINIVTFCPVSNAALISFLSRSTKTEQVQGKKKKGAGISKQDSRRVINEKKKATKRTIPKIQIIQLTI